MIDRFSAATVTLIGAEIEESLTTIAEKYGISITAPGGTYEDMTATLKLKLLIKDSSGEPILPERYDFLQYAQEYGLQPSDLDREFVYNGYRWTVVGLKTGRPKFPILARKKIDGRMFKLTADAVKFALLREDTNTDQRGTSPFTPQLRLIGNDNEGE